MSLKSGLIALGFAGLFGSAAIVGCSASGDSGVGEDTTPTNPDDGTTHLPPPSNTSGGDPTDAGKDANKPDGAKQDAGKDAGPPPPTPGTPCTTANEKKSKDCGKCGKAETLCIDDGTGLKWSEYGQCENEVGICEPGKTQACGNCGTQTCTNYCAWTACGGQPANSCAPGSTESSTAGCAAANTYRTRSCGAACTWGNYSATCEAPNMYVPTAVGQTSTSTWALASTKVGKKVTGTCGSASLTSTADYPYFGVQVTNTNASQVTVQVFHSGSGTPLDTVLWVYNGSTYPTDDNSLKACAKGVADNCTGGTLADVCGNAANGGSSYDWAGLDDVVIPAGGTILVYSAGYSQGELGAFNLNVKVKSIP